MAQVASDTVVLKKEATGLVTVSINRPEARNALSYSMLIRLGATFKELAEDSSVRCIILRGEGSSFCSGVDLNAAAQVWGKPAATEGEVAKWMERCKAPIVTCVQGACINAGFEIALASDVLLVTPDAKLIDWHCRLGIAPSWGLSQKLARAVGASRAKLVSFTGAPIDGTTAARWGLASKLVPREQLDDEARCIASFVLEAEPRTLREYKEVMDAGLGTTLAQGLTIEGEVAAAAYANMGAEDFKRITATLSQKKPLAKL